MSLADELWQETKGQRGVGLFLLFEPISVIDYLSRLEIVTKSSFHIKLINNNVYFNYCSSRRPRQHDRQDL
jgi:hypothetical protein